MKNPSSPLRFLMFSLGFLAGGAASLSASELAWAQTEAALAVAPGQTECEAIFSFRNPGQTPVAIVGLMPDCDCVTATADSAAVPPGGHGFVKVTVALHGESGLLRKSVTVRTTPANAAPDRLILRIRVPAIATLEPEVLAWSGHDYGQAKEFRLRLNPEAHGRLKGVTSDFPDLALEVKPVEPDQLYRIIVTPQRTGTPRHITLKIAVDLNGTERVFPATVVLR